MYGPPPPPIREALLGRVIPTVMDRGAKVMDRILAIRDMGRVGHLLGADSLIDLLRDGDAALKEEVVWSLEAISGRVLGDDVEPWSSWWDGLPGRGIGASDSQRPGVEGQDSG